MAGPLPNAGAAITSSGNVDPDPAGWDVSIHGYIGNTADGALTIDHRTWLYSNYGYLGYSSATTGVVNVDGSGTRWSNWWDIYVGYGGNGRLNITNGGYVRNEMGKVSVGETADATGIISVDGLGSILDVSGNRLFIGESGLGALIVTGGGQVGGGSYRQTIVGATGVVSIDGAGSAVDFGSTIHVGDNGRGIVSITGGGAAGGYHSYVEHGVVAVGGVGSTWTNYGVFHVQNTGTLKVTHGGVVSGSSEAGIWGDSFSKGIATVDGPGSTWSSMRLIVDGALNVTGGGHAGVWYNQFVTNNVEVFGAQSLVTIDTGSDSLLDVGGGQGTLYNAGTIRIVAGAKPPGNAVFTPIAAANWTGTGTYQALGGKWSDIDHTFTPSALATGNSGDAMTIDLNDKQRVIVSDDGVGKTNWSVAVSFAPTSEATGLTLTAAAVCGSALDALQAQIPAEQSVVSAWTFTANNGYAPGDPIYLSFLTGAGFSAEDFALWHYDSGGWSAHSANDLTYDGAYVNFTAADLTGFAVTVPEPSALVVVGLGLLSLAAASRGAFQVKTR